MITTERGRPPDSTEKYDRFDSAPDSTHNLVVALVPAGARVLEFGCATGYMSAVLRERLGCTVTGVEISESAAEQARPHLDRLIVGDAEALGYATLFGDERFDAILFADVLEHLRDPAEVLRRVRPLLAEGGAVVASIPNVAHGSVRLALLDGEFRYREMGLLDDTHLRFFTRQTVQELFEQSGFVVERWCRRHIDVDETELDLPVDRLAETIRDALAADPEVTTYQFVVRAVPAGAALAGADAGQDRASGPSTLATLQERVGVLEARSAHLEERQEIARQLKRDRSSTQRLLEAAERQREELRDLIVAQGARLDTLVGQVERLAEREDRVAREVSEDLGRLARRNDQLQSLLYDLALSQAEATGDDASDGRASAYRRMLRRLREVVRATLPPDATVVVVNKGDPALLDLYGREGLHFPQAWDGQYPGYYPASDTAAIAQLETLRAKGAGYIVFPSTALWWLDHYPRFGRYLEQRYPLLVQQDETCRIYDLRTPILAQANGWADLRRVTAAVRAQAGRKPAILTWRQPLDVGACAPEGDVFAPPTEDDRLPYLDRSVDVVVTADAPEALAEARRVASVAVFTATAKTGDGPSGDGLSLAWQADGLSVVLPSVSILIPTYNGMYYTEKCLMALRETVPADLRCEIIVVDDASTDDTPDRLQRLAEQDERVTILRNERNLHFLATNNRAAEVAGGEYLVLLNNDTIPLPGWLEPLLNTFRDYPDAGVVGGKLIYPDGVLQEAGGIVYRDASGANFGKWELNAEDPLFNYVREVDYVSGALLVTRRSLWRQIGGFDARFRPIYYEDSDYCFQVRERGFRVYYQPESVVIHVEGGHSGRDTSTGDKRYQAANRSRFAEKWATALALQPRPPSDYGWDTLHRIAVRDVAAGEGNR